MGAVRDGLVRVGDAIAVFGLGAIGLFIVQLAKIQGAELVFAADPIELRRDAATAVGADGVFDPNACDVSYEIKKATDKRGADVNFEVSGNYNALHHAIRSVAFGGNVATVAVYKEAKGGFELGAEWHLNRPNLISTRALVTQTATIRDGIKADYRYLLSTSQRWEPSTRGYCPTSCTF